MENKVLKEGKIKSIEKALDLLELLSDSTKEMGITEISKELHMGVSTVYRILTALKYRGYIVQNPQTFKYMTGVKLFILGRKAQNTKNLIRILTPFLQKLSQRTNETINLAILEGREVICLYKIESPEILRADIEIGSKLPAHCSAVGKVLLAFSSEQDFKMLYGRDNKKLLTFTSKSISSVKELKKCLNKVKKDGYAIDEEEFITGINCMGIPVINNEGKAIAGISVTGPSSRFNLSRMKKFKNILISVSKDISNQLNRVNKSTVLNRVIY